LSVEDAQTLLRAAVPDLDTRAGRGQIEFVDYRNWYLDGGRLDPDRAPARLRGGPGQRQCLLAGELVAELR